MHLGKSFLKGMLSPPHHVLDNFECCPFPQRSLVQSRRNLSHLWLGEFTHNCSVKTATKWCLTHNRASGMHWDVGAPPSNFRNYKGQLISKCPFGIIVLTKLPTKNLTNSALEWVGQNLSNFSVGILVETMTPEGHFEINWPLVEVCKCKCWV